MALQPALATLPPEVSEQANQYVIDYLAGTYRDNLKCYHPEGQTHLGFYKEVINQYASGGLAYECMNFVLREHHHHQLWMKNKSEVSFMTEFFFHQYSKVIDEDGVYKKLRLGVKELLAGKEPEESRREAIKTMNLVKYFSRMIYSNSETYVADCIGEYKADKDFLRKVADRGGLNSSSLHRCFFNYVQLLKDIGRIWAARLLKDFRIDMHELEKETGCILFPVADPAQWPDGLNHGNYRYYVDKYDFDPLDDQCCVFDKEQAKELLDALRCERKKGKRGANVKPGAKETRFADFIVNQLEVNEVINIIKRNISKDVPKQVALVIIGGIEAGKIHQGVTAPSIEREFDVKGDSVKPHLTKYRGYKTGKNNSFSADELKPYKDLFIEHN